MAEPGTTNLGGGHYLRPDAAAAYLAMRRDGCPAGITSSTRSYARQTDLYRNQGRPGWPALADHPDRSKHVWRPTSTRDTGARALDLPDIGGVMNPDISPRAWVRLHGHRYGWMKDRVRGEVWHVEFEPWNADVELINRVVHVPDVPTGPVLTPPAPIEEDDVPKAIQFIAKDAQNRDHLYVAFPHSRTYERIGSLAEREEFRRVLERQGFEWIEWENAANDQRVTKPRVFGTYVGADEFRPAGA